MTDVVRNPAQNDWQADNISDKIKWQCDYLSGSISDELQSYSSHLSQMNL